MVQQICNPRVSGMQLENCEHARWWWSTCSVQLYKHMPVWLVGHFLRSSKYAAAWLSLECIEVLQTSVGLTALLGSHSFGNGWDICSHVLQVSREKLTFQKQPCKRVRAKAEQSPFNGTALRFWRQVVELESVFNCLFSRGYTTILMVMFGKPQRAE